MKFKMLFNNTSFPKIRIYGFGRGIHISTPNDLKHQINIHGGGILAASMSVNFNGVFYAHDIYHNNDRTTLEVYLKEKGVI